MNKTLKYISPAKSFTEALPLGNGSLGAMVYGGVPEEKIRCVEHETDAPAELELDGTDKVFILHDLTTPQLTKQVRDGILARLEEKEAQA